MTDEDDVELPNLRGIEPPLDEEPEDWERFEKCAWLYNEVKEAGHPDLINKSEAAEFFGVTYQTVYNYLNDYVYPYMRAEVGDRHLETSNSVYQRAVRELMQAGEFEKAARVNKMWNDFLSERGVADKEPDKHEIEHRSDLSDEDRELLDDMF